MPPCNDNIDLVEVSLTGSVGAQEVHVGENYRLTCNVTGGVTTEPTHRWFRDGTPLNVTSATLSFSPLRETDSGVYTCEGTRSSITITSENFTITAASEFQMCICNYIISKKNYLFRKSIEV